MADFFESLGFKAEGLEPSADIKNNGFQAGYKPPASYFNWFFTGVTKRLDELREYCKELKEAVRSQEEDGTVNFDDLNKCIEVGMYTYSAGNASNVANRPEPSVKVQTTVLTLPRLTDYDMHNLIQIAITSANMIYVRNKQDGVWTDWQKVFTSANGNLVPIKNGGTGADSVTQARSNLGLPESCTNLNTVANLNNDWNNAVKTGWYKGNNSANAPETSTTTDLWFFGRVLAHNADYVFQEVYKFASSTDAKLIAKYIRAKTNGTWGSWTNVTVQRVVPAEAKLDFIKTLTSDAQTQLNNKMASTPRRIEFTSEADAGDGGYLDFHFNGLAEDYTSRIIESAKGILSFLCDRGSFRGDITVHGGYPVYSSKDTIPVEHGGTGATDVGNARSNLGFASGSYSGIDKARTIKMGNSGNVVAIWSDEYLGFYSKAGGFAFGNNTGVDAAYNPSTDVKFENGVLTIHRSFMAVEGGRTAAINKNNVTYNYQIL